MFSFIISSLGEKDFKKIPFYKLIIVLFLLAVLFIPWLMGKALKRNGEPLFGFSEVFAARSGCWPEVVLPIPPPPPPSSSCVGGCSCGGGGELSSGEGGGCFACPSTAEMEAAALAHAIAHGEAISAASKSKGGGGGGGGGSSCCNCCCCS